MKKPSPKSVVAVAVFLAVTAIAAWAAWRHVADRFVDAINEKWPPVTSETVRADALRNAVDNLAKLRSPALAAGLSMSTAESLLRTVDLPDDLGVRQLSLGAADQVLLVTATVDAVLGSGQDTVRISGRTAADIGVDVSIAAKAGGLADAAVLTLRPAFTMISLDAVEVGEWPVAEPTVEAINELVEVFLARLNGALQGRRELSIRFPLVLTSVFDPQRIVASDPKLGLAIEGTAVPVTLAVKAFAVRISPDGIAVIAEATTNANSASSPTDAQAAAIATSDDYRKRFDALLEQYFGAANSTAPAWIGVTRKALFQGVADTLNRSKICARLAPEEKSLPFSEKIRLPDGTGIDCAPTRDCSNEDIRCDIQRECSFSNIDCAQDRECSGRHINCGGYKWYQAPDKLRCEAEKSAWKLDCERFKSQEKATCEADKAAKKFDCERIKSEQKALCETDKAAWTGACEAEKTKEQLLCETEKGVLNLLSRTGNFANINGRIRGTPRLSACIAQARMNEDGKGLALVLAVQGIVESVVTLNFVPLDIVGHFACQAPWSDEFPFTVNVSEQAISLTADVLAEQRGIGGEARVRLEPFDLSIRLDPAPLDALLESENFTISCVQVAGLFHIADIALRDQLPANMLGIFDITQPALEFAWPLRPAQFEVGPLSGEGTLQINDRSISVLATTLAAPAP